MQNSSISSKKLTLAEAHPEIARQWHHEKNKQSGLTPDNITSGCDKKVWWKCAKGADHEWEARVYSRTKNGAGKCPICLNYKVVLSNCLYTTHPVIAKQWHPTKNGDLSPYDVCAGGHKKIWWKCSNGDDHEWQATIYDRTKINASGCAVCHGNKVVFSNCLSTTHPDLTKQWHPTKNGKLNPNAIKAGSHKKVWWQCPLHKDHVWFTEVRVRAILKCACPMCEGLQSATSNCLATLNPQVSSEWHPYKNGVLTPDKVVVSSNKKVWWQCKISNDHVWQAQIISRTKKIQRDVHFVQEKRSQIRIVSSILILK